MPEQHFCEEHSGVMRCLGKIEQAGEDAKEVLKKVEAKLDCLILKFEVSQKSNGVDKKFSAVEHARDSAKANIIYWVLGIAGGGLVLSIVNRVFPVIFK